MKSGIMVVIKCTKSMNIATLSSLGMMKAIPITTSNTPNQTRNVSGGMKGIVILRRAKTKGLAGLRPKTLSRPNQK